MNNFNLSNKLTLQTIVQAGAKVNTFSYNPNVTVGNPETALVNAGWVLYYREATANLVEAIYIYPPGGNAPSIIITDTNGVTAGQVTVNESGLGSGSVHDGSNITTGTMTVVALNGLASITFGATVVTYSQLIASSVTPVPIAMTRGTITVTGYNDSTGLLNYSYGISSTVVSAGTSSVDTLTITVTDSLNITASTTFTATIIDDVSTANNDTITILTVNTVASGTLATNDVVGADAPGVWAVSVAPTHGMVNITSSTGAYTYTPTDGYTGSDSFTYTLTDADGDVSTATVNITVGWGVRRMGLGLGGVTYYDNSFAFADLAKHGNIVQSNFAAYTAFDSLRNPTTDCLMVITSAKLKNGVYKLTFTGKCDSLGANGGSIAVSNKVYNVGTNTTTADVTLSDESVSSNRWVSFTGSHATNVAATNTGVSNIRLMRPGYTTETFTTEFLAAMRTAKILRGMDWVYTNSNDSVTWADRHTPLHQGVSPTRGASWEELIILANQSNNDVWLNFPAKADDTYILKLAQLVKYGSDGTNPYTSVQANPVYPPLSSTLRVYTEYGNEVWNSGGGFSCFGWALAFANTYRNDTTHPIAYDGVVADQYEAQKRWIAYRASVISLTFRTVFGDSAMGVTVRPILAAQTGNGNGYLASELNWAKGFYSAVRGTPPLNPTIRTVPDLFYGISGAAYLDSTSNSPADSSASSLNAYFAGIPAPEFSDRIRIDSMWAKAWGLKVVAYEGGPEPGGSYLGSTASPGAVSAAINNDSRMSTVMTTAQTIWDSYGGDEFVYYIYSGAGNAWSFTNNVTTPVVSDIATPKMSAFATLNQTTQSDPTFGLATQGTFNLKSSTDRVIGSNAAAGYQSGACYLLSSNTAYIYVAILSRVSITRRVYLTMMNTNADVLTVYCNGVASGNITPTVEAADIVRVTTDYGVVSLVPGVNVIAIRKSTSTGNSYIRDITLTSNNVKMLYVNLTNPVNVDLGNSQGTISIFRY